VSVQTALTGYMCIWLAITTQSCDSQHKLANGVLYCFSFNIHLLYMCCWGNFITWEVYCYRGGTQWLYV